MTDEASKIPSRIHVAHAQDSAIWIQKDAVHLRGSSVPAKSNPFAQPLAASYQTPSGSVAPVGPEQKKK